MGSIPIVFARPKGSPPRAQSTSVVDRHCGYLRVPDRHVWGSRRACVRLGGEAPRMPQCASVDPREVRADASSEAGVAARRCQQKVRRRNRMWRSVDVAVGSDAEGSSRTAWWQEEWTPGCSMAHFPPGILTPTDRSSASRSDGCTGPEPRPQRRRTARSTAPFAQANARPPRFSITPEQRDAQVQ
jgi:hypothetical protein